MRFTSLMMYISPLLLFIFYAYVGFSEAAPRISDASPSVLLLLPGKKPPRSASETSSSGLSSNTTDMPKKRSPDHGGIVAHHVGPLTALVLLEPSPTIVSAPPPPPPDAAAAATLQPAPSSSADVNTDVIPTTMERKITAAATSDVSSSRRRKRSSTDAQTSVFPREKMLQTMMVSMVSPQRTANDAWSADHIDATSITSTESSREALCNCSSGSEGILDSEDCEPSTGQCSCLSGYTGLQCEDCEVGHFTNGTTGCLPCGCDSYGAVNNLCDSSGICVCKTGVYGPKCDECHPGFFRFSSTGCQPCQCNNHTNYCHPQSGVCLNCLNNTQGANCEECKPKHYRSASAALADACVPCPCLNTTSTGSCHSDAGGFPVCDQCLPQYSGARCDECSAGFYKLAGKCVPCECSGNADPKGPAQICHPDTGHCLRCGNNTTGPHCQLCAPGFTGDARAHNCSPAASRIIPTPADVTTTAPTKSSTSSLSPPLATSTPSTTAGSTSAASPQTTNTSTVPPPRAASSTSSTTAATQTLLTSLGSPTDNTTAARTEVSWTQFNIIILAVIILVVLLLLGFVGGVYTYREYQNRKLNAPFWTIELKEDNISFSSYHDSIPNADVSGLLEDEANEVAPNGQLALTTQGNCYIKA